MGHDALQGGAFVAPARSGEAAGRTGDWTGPGGGRMLRIGAACGGDGGVYRWWAERRMERLLGWGFATRRIGMACK